MHFKFHLDPKTGRLFVNRETGIAIVILVLLIVGIAGFFLFQVFTSHGKLFAPEEDLSPITSLGLSEKDATDSAKVADAVFRKMQKEHENTLAIIFFYDGYLDQKQALRDIEVLKESLKVVEPFKSAPDLLSFKTLTTNGQRCHVEGSPKVLVCDKELIESFRKLGIEHVKVVILSPLEFIPSAQYARGANTWMTISSFQGLLSDGDFKRWLGITFMNNLGKSLGLKNEVSNPDNASFPSDIQKSSTAYPKEDFSYGKPNCAKDRETAKEWWGQYVTDEEATGSASIGYFNGCAGSRDYVYPEKNTLMSDRPEKESFGKVSEDYLRGVLFCFYGGKESIVFPAGKEPKSNIYRNCETFRKEFPSFWEE